MWQMTFINHYGTTFTTNEAELGTGSVLDYIQYCLDRKSILVSLEQI